MKKLFVLMMVTLLIASVGVFAQEKSQKTTQKKAATTQTATKPAAKSAQEDKVIAGKKGPDGETVYQGSQGGQYYINKSGNKTYLKEVDKIVPNKKGPNGEIVYVGSKGGQYYLNANGEKVYLSKDKK